MTTDDFKPCVPVECPDVEERIVDTFQWWSSSRQQWMAGPVDLDAEIRRAAGLP